MEDTCILSNNVMRLFEEKKGTKGRPLAPCIGVVVVSRQLAVPICFGFVGGVERKKERKEITQLGCEKYIIL
jgi:hypothetical protein